MTIMTEANTDVSQLILEIEYERVRNILEISSFET